MGALLLRFGPWAAIVLLGLLSLNQHDQLVTWRLKDKDQKAVEFNLHRDIADRDAKIDARSGAETIDRGASDRTCSADISSSFQKGVAVGRAIQNHASASPSAAPGGLLAPRIVRDYGEAWSRDAYTPGS